jgi:uncharacterized repeat protein (TIGR04042 family)
MPETHFRVRWPDQSTTLCYSPSSTIRETFVINQSYVLAEFVALAKQALEHASERVRKKYGYGCAHASWQIDEIRQIAMRFAEDQNARVIVEGFE